MSRRSMKPRMPDGPTRSASGSTTAYITPRGYRQLVDELERLWKVERPPVTEAVTEAAALGDRSENAEYLYGKKKLRQIDGRVRFLSKRIDELEIVRPTKAQHGRVFFGAWVTVENEDGEQSRWQIVGPDEYDTKQNRISVDAPMAKALLGKSVGDEVPVVRPKGKVVITIIDIEYDAL